MTTKESIKKLKFEIPNKLFIGHLNINSIRNNFEFMFDIVGKNVDVFLISETKLNKTFPNGQFLLNGLHEPFRKDRTDNGRWTFVVHKGSHLERIEPPMGGCT